MSMGFEDERFQRVRRLQTAQRYTGTIDNLIAALVVVGSHGAHHRNCNHQADPYGCRAPDHDNQQRRRSK